MHFDFAQCKQKGSAQILFLLGGIVILLGGFFLYSHKSNSYQSLTNPITKLAKDNTYTNQTLGFQFEYPTSLKVVEDTEQQFDKRGNGNYRKNFKGYIWYEPGKVLGISVVLGKDDAYDNSPLTVWVFDNPENLSIESWDKKYWYYPFVWGDFTSRRNAVAPINEATISGTMAKYGIVDYQENKPKFIYISKDGKMYMLRVIGEEGEKILKTFKFL